MFASILRAGNYSSAEYQPIMADTQDSSVPLQKQSFEVGADSDSDVSPESNIAWSDEEERKLVRKLDTVVMPLLVIAFMALQFDRGNVLCHSKSLQEFD